MDNHTWTGQTIGKPTIRRQQKNAIKNFCDYRCRVNKSMAYNHVSFPGLETLYEKPMIPRV